MPIGIRTRHGTTLSSHCDTWASKWPGAESKDIGDRIAILTEQFDHYDEVTLNKYKKNHDDCLVFDVADAAAWVRAANGNVRHQINNRRLRTEQGL